MWCPDPEVMSFAIDDALTPPSCASVSGQHAADAQFASTFHAALSHDPV